MRINFLWISTVLEITNEPVPASPFLLPPNSIARSKLFVASSVPHLFPGKQPIIVFIQTNFRAFVWKNIATLKFSLIEKIFWEQTEQREKKEERNFVLMTSCKAGFDELEEKRGIKPEIQTRLILQNLLHPLTDRRQWTNN